VAINEDGAGSWLVDAADEVQQGGFAAAAGAGDGEEFAGIDFERNAVESDDTSMVHGVAAANVAELNEWLHWVPLF
jgi:hypothetical protein